MKCLWLLLLMVLNGIIFLPPSEYIYFEAYWCYSKELSYLYYILPLMNTIGHYVLFLFIRSKYKTQNIPLIRKVVINSQKYSKIYFTKYDTNYLAILYGRCIPVVHTGISIVAGLSSVSKQRFLILTLIGNYIFSIVCYVIISFVSKNNDYKITILYVFLVFSVIYIIHIFLEKFIHKMYKS